MRNLFRYTSVGTLCVLIVLLPLPFYASCSVFSEPQRQTLEEGLTQKEKQVAAAYSRGELTEQQMQSELVRIAQARASLQADRDTEQLGLGIGEALGLNAATAASILGLIRVWRGSTSNRKGIERDPKVVHVEAKP